MKKLLVIAILAVLASCASAPKLDYYTLDMAPSAKVDSDLDLAVQRFAVAEKLDRHQIVIQKTSTRIDFYATDRWATGVGAMVEQKLAAELGPTGNGGRNLTVSGTVVAFEQVDTAAGPQGFVRLEVEIRDGGAKRFETPLLEKTYEARRAADSNSVDAVVQALSRAIEAIAAEIAEDAAGL